MLDINDPRATPEYKAKVKKAYDAFKAETRAQYDQLIKDGYSFSFHPEGTDPYRITPQFAVQDVKKNKKMTVFPTTEGFGAPGPGAAPAHPLLEDTGLVWGQRKSDGSFANKPVTYNDLFRAVHDVYGHAKEGVGFRADGEDNAYLSHSAMYSPEAKKAMASETRGQNSWVNYGPHGTYNRKAGGDRTWFAPQKAGILPQEHIDRGTTEATTAAPAAAPAAAPGPAIPPAPQAPPKAGVSVPAMITRQMEADLKTSGYSQAEINKMTPAQAHRILQDISQAKGGAAPAEEEGPTTAAERAALVEKHEGKLSEAKRQQLKEKTLAARNKKGKPKARGEEGGLIGADRAARVKKFLSSDTDYQKTYSELHDMTDEEFWDAAGHIISKYESEFAKLPNDLIEPDYNYSGTAAVGFEGDGKITFVYNPTAVAARELTGQKKGLDPMKVTNAIIGEEQTHAAWLNALKNDWVKGGKDGSFGRHVREEIMDLARDMRQAIEKAPYEERDGLYQAIADSENIYEGGFDRPLSDRLNRGKQILENIESEIYNWPNTLKFGSEFLRQARQAQKNGAITEETRKTIFRTIGAWVDKALQRIYKAFPGIQEGKYGTLVQEHLQKIEDVLAGKDVVAHEPVTVQRGGTLRREGGLMGAEKKASTASRRIERSMDELKKIAKDYERFKTWYEDFDQFLDSILKDNVEYKPLVKDFMAAMSQMGGIGRNTQQMLNKLEEFITTGTVTKPGIDFPAKPKLGNLQQAMAGLPLSGPKIGPSRALRETRGCRHRSARCARSVW
jgi:hypothetical protein